MSRDQKCELRILAYKEKILQQVAQLHTEQYQRDLNQQRKKINALEEEISKLNRAAESKEIHAAGLDTKWESELNRLREENADQKREIAELARESHNLRAYNHNMQKQYRAWSSKVEHQLHKRNSTSLQVPDLNFDLLSRVTSPDSQSIPGLSCHIQSHTLIKPKGTASRMDILPEAPEIGTQKQQSAPSPSFRLVEETEQCIQPLNRAKSHPAMNESSDSLITHDTPVIDLELTDTMESNMTMIRSQETIGDVFNESNLEDNLPGKIKRNLSSLFLKRNRFKYHTRIPSDSTYSTNTRGRSCCLVM